MNCITNGIEISAETSYYAPQSDPRAGFYFFVYQISIANKSSEPIQLMKRHWFITDALGEQREVKGDGVVGETPVIEPGDSFTYNSGCHFATEIGKMKGFYIMRKPSDMSELEVQIPEMLMVLPAKLN